MPLFWIPKCMYVCMYTEYVTMFVFRFFPKKKKKMKMNKAVDAPAINKMMKEFEKENMKSELMQEIMGDMMDDVMEQDGDAEEEDKIVSQVLDEIGVTFSEEIPDAPIQGTGTQVAEEPVKNTKVAVASANDSTLNDLEARLNNLNNDTPKA